ncbi:fused MFS/spermidine synthase [Delftia acidovorans]|uniref:fused MFS/spermidine synthase n=1 Tax=Delftia acidovorans TaxID=80866 RepID=UPI001EFD2F60|nr:fused MFS/spermidine synthase [Delftia acidovorans]MCG8989101.1 fused MFS/spermidine synthase [Delftia acidovorans]
MQSSNLAPSSVKLVDVLLLLSFFISGCSALIYQICWQRTLYGIIGVDIDSITIIVSIFMLGIGIGGMLGGRLSDSYPKSRLSLYIAAEISIATYGFFSITILAWIESVLGSHTSSGSAISAFSCALFLILPTILMGMTLPLLTIAFNEKRQNIGLSIGNLYFSNTLGAAAGAALVPFALLPRWSLDQVILIGVVGNILVSILALASIYGAELNQKS